MALQNLGLVASNNSILNNVAEEIPLESITSSEIQNVVQDKSHQLKTEQLS